MPDQTNDEVDWVEDDDLVDEEIDEAEVERALDILSGLMEKVKSESIKEILDDACCEIASLLPDEDEDDDDESAEAA